jgi:hypothetical protein
VGPRAGLDAVALIMTPDGVNDLLTTFFNHMHLWTYFSFKATVYKNAGNLFYIEQPFSFYTSVIDRTEHKVWRAQFFGPQQEGK